MNRIRLIAPLALLALLASTRVKAADDFKIEVSGFGGIDEHFPSLSGNPQLEQNILGAAQSGAGLAGVSTNPTITGGSNLKWAAGGGVAVPLTRSLYVTGEFSREAMGGANIGFNVDGTPASLAANLSFLQITGGAQYLLGNTDRRMVPFVSGGAGAARQTLVASASQFGISSSASSITASEYVGGGVRIKLGPSWGIRPEVRMIHVPIANTLGVPGSWYVRSSVAFYWRMGH